MLLKWCFHSRFSTVIVSYMCPCVVCLVSAIQVPVHFSKHFADFPSEVLADFRTVCGLNNVSLHKGVRVMKL